MSLSSAANQASKTPSFITRDNTSSPDDWLNTDDVASRGNVSDEEQVGSKFLRRSAKQKLNMIALSNMRRS